MQPNRCKVRKHTQTKSAALTSQLMEVLQTCRGRYQQNNSRKRHTDRDQLADHHRFQRETFDNHQYDRNKRTKEQFSSKQEEATAEVRIRVDHRTKAEKFSQYIQRLSSVNINCFTLVSVLMRTFLGDFCINAMMHPTNLHPTWATAAPLLKAELTC